MGAQTSYIYNHCRRLVLRYNAENRAHKFLEEGHVAKAPRHSLPSSLEDLVLSEEQIKELHGKNEQLSEYLKKVYLTSTSKVVGTPSKRPKPKKENEILKVFMFYEPEKPKPGYCTLSSMAKILMQFEGDMKNWSPSMIAHEYNLKKHDVVQLTMYYSLYTAEKLRFMNAKPKEEVGKEEEEKGPRKVEFEVFNKLVKKPLKKIQGK